MEGFSKRKRSGGEIIVSRDANLGGFLAFDKFRRRGRRGVEAASTASDIAVANVNSRVLWPFIARVR